MCFKSRDTIHKHHGLGLGLGLGAFLLAIIATPIDSAYSMHNAYTFSSCAQLSTQNEMAKIVQSLDFNVLNNAHDILLAIPDDRARRIKAVSYNLATEGIDNKNKNHNNIA